MARQRSNPERTRPESEQPAESTSPAGPETELAEVDTRTMADPPADPERDVSDVDDKPVDAATAEQTTDYSRRAGGWVLTDRGWVIEDEAD